MGSKTGGAGQRHAEKLFILTPTQQLGATLDLRTPHTKKHVTSPPLLAPHMPDTVITIVVVIMAVMVMVMMVVNDKCTKN